MQRRYMKYQNKMALKALLFTWLCCVLYNEMAQGVPVQLRSLSHSQVKEESHEKRMAPIPQIKVLTLHEVKQLLKRVLRRQIKTGQTTSTTASRRQRGLRSYKGDRRLRCLRKNSKGRCIRFAVLGMWTG